MATGSSSHVAKRSRMVEDFCCGSCKEQNLMESAESYCETCLRFYCKKCVIHHSQLFIKHTTCGREDIKKWPVSKEVEDFLMKCEVHEDNTLIQFCHDHSQLCCSDCVVAIHSQCSKVTLISELPNKQYTGLQGLSVELETVIGEIQSLQSSQEASVKSLQDTYKDLDIAFMVELMLVKTNTTIDEYGKGFLRTFAENEQFMKEDICRSVLSILNEFDTSNVKELNEMKDEVMSIKGSITSSIHKRTGLQNDLTKFYKTIQKIGENKELCLIASIKCERKIQQAWTVLGKSDKVFTVNGKSLHNVRIPSDSVECDIIEVCVLTDGKVLLVDYNNKNIKLLNQQYKVVSHLDVATYNGADMCQITSSEVAVAFDVRKVQFITVNQTQMLIGRKLQLQHNRTGIAHHQGDLFICTGSALYKYKLSGKLVCILYADASDWNTVCKCAVSPTGDKLYITNIPQHKLLTLDRNGTVLATLIDTELRSPRRIDVTPAGQVLVCGWGSHNILQVDNEGKRKLATLISWESDRLTHPLSVRYCSTTSSIIVVHTINDNILVLRM